MRKLLVAAAVLTALVGLARPVGAIQAPTIQTPKTGDLVPAAPPSKVRIAGTASPNTTVELFDGAGVSAANVGSATANSSGRWVLDAALANGAHTLTAVAANDLTAASDAVAFEVDAVRPPAPRVKRPSDGAVFGPGETVRLEGDAIDDRGVLVVQTEYYLLNKLVLRQNVQCSCGGTEAFWSHEPELPGAGYYVVKVAAYDLAGNRGDPRQLAIFWSGLQAAAVPLPPAPEGPKPPVIHTPEPSTVVPAADNGGKTVVQGTAPPGSRVQLIETNAGLGTLNDSRTTVAHPKSGVWTFTTRFGDGSYTLRARAIDRRGRVSPLGTAVNFTVDARRPVLNVETESDDIPMTFLPTQPIELRGVVNDDRHLAAVQLEYWWLNRLVLRENAICECTRRSQAVWVDRPALSMPGYYHVQVRAIDAAGNRSSTSVITFLKAA